MYVTLHKASRKNTFFIILTATAPNEFEECDRASFLKWSDDGARVPAWLHVTAHWWCSWMLRNKEQFLVVKHSPKAHLIILLMVTIRIVLTWTFDIFVTCGVLQHDSSGTSRMFVQNGSSIHDTVRGTRSMTEYRILPTRTGGLLQTSKNVRREFWVLCVTSSVASS